jgi:hypothetical protein
LDRDKPNAHIQIRTHATKIQYKWQISKFCPTQNGKYKHKVPQKPQYNFLANSHFEWVKFATCIENFVPQYKNFKILPSSKWKIITIL